MSFSFVGRVYSSLKGFYNEINSATLTGAIDVVIVKQPDGSYYSSPFHVRFGKLGVLRAREKIVDIEINGQSVGLHMKLGEAGEAFFVQEFTHSEEEVEFPAELATSPIQSADELMAEGLAQLKEESQRQELQARLHQHAQAQAQGPSADGRSEQASRLYAQEALGGGHQLESQQQQASLVEDYVAETLDLSSLTKDAKSDSSYEDDKRRGKPRRKVLKKKKQKHGGGGGGMRSSPRSQSMPEGLGAEHDPIFDMEVTESTSEEEEMAAYSLGASRSMSLDMKKSMGVVGEELELSPKDRRLSSLETLMTPFSDPEMTPPQSPLPTRPPSPKSDTEVDRQHTEENQQKMLQESAPTWDWGQFPTQTPLPLPDQDPGPHTIDSALERQDSEKTSSGGLLSLWGSRPKSQKKVTVAGASSKQSGTEEKGMYLDDLTSLEDPEIAKLYLGSPRFQSIREREREEDSESGRGASLPQSPHSVDGAIGGPVSFLESEVRHLGPVALSLCGGLSEPDGITLDKFMKKVMTYDDLVEQPSVISNPDLVVKIREGYYNWATAAPMVLCEMAFNKCMPEAAVASLMKKHMPKKTLKKKTSGLSWWSWRSSTNQNAEGGTDDTSSPVSSAPLSVTIPVTGVTVTSDNEGASSKVSEASLSPLVSPATSPPTSAHGTPKKFTQRRRSSLGTETDTDNSEKEVTSAPVLSALHSPACPPHPPSSQSMPPPSSSVAIPTPSPSLVLPPSSSPPMAMPPHTPAPSPSSKKASPSSSSGVDPTQLRSKTAPISISQAAHTASPPSVSPPSSSQATPASLSPRTPPHPPPSSSSPLAAPSGGGGSQAMGQEAGRTPPGVGRPAEEEVGGESSRLAAATEAEEVKVNLEQGREKFFKTLRLTSEQVSKLNLREGQNEIRYSVTTQYQGTTRCISHIYLWNHDDKIVISDIDGTITKSDVMGQILPLIGRDWSQSGVARLFTRLSTNGYKLLYLSARAIGQARHTKELLRSIRQGDRVLPDGPLLLNPTSLISAFHREVIVKNPEEFKIHCLKDIANLFPSSPFYAGFGNKVNDVIAYRALQIPSFRIFTINPQGQLRHEFSHTFLSSYTKMSDVADHFFPPIDVANRSISNEYSNVNYWRTPPPTIETIDISILASAEDGGKASTTTTTAATATATTTTTTCAPSAATTTSPPSTTTTTATTTTSVTIPIEEGEEEELLGASS
ncbi:phosphatidate phosphatase LPIN1-like [Babylonia areolata]|uniref:phosphatidate phosphatase LPIN1-like n=1 Tax=Babylonia areolata TaxID=304850 RepID=UPI003FD41778